MTGFAVFDTGNGTPMTTSIHPHGKTAIPRTRSVATAEYLLKRGLRPHEVIDALVSQLGIGIEDAHEATAIALAVRGSPEPSSPAA